MSRKQNIGGPKSSKREEPLLSVVRPWVGAAGKAPALRFAGGSLLRRNLRRRAARRRVAVVLVSSYLGRVRRRHLLREARTPLTPSRSPLRKENRPARKNNRRGLVQPAVGPRAACLPAAAAASFCQLDPTCASANSQHRCTLATLGSRWKTRNPQACRPRISPNSAPSPSAGPGQCSSTST
jgi:hypothetical protein